MPRLEYFRTDSIAYIESVQTQLPQVSVISKEDILAIVVSSLNRESNEILNFNNVATLPMSVFSGNIGGGSQPLGYPLDSTGSVTLPLIGKIKLEGVSLAKAEEKIRIELEKSIKAPVVNVRYMNHKFSVLGDVNKTGTYNLLDDRTTILDAIALAGDLTMFGKRDSITIIRDKGNIREIGLVSLRNRSVFSSPYFYIKNGDIIYVEPTKEKVLPEIPYQQAPPPSLALQRLPLYVSLLSVITVLVSLIRP